MQGGTLPAGSGGQCLCSHAGRCRYRKVMTTPELVPFVSNNKVDIQILLFRITVCLVFQTISRFLKGHGMEMVYTSLRPPHGDTNQWQFLPSVSYLGAMVSL